MMSFRTLFAIFLGILLPFFAVANQDSVIGGASSGAEALMNDAHFSAPKRLAPKFANELFKRGSDPIQGNPNAEVAIVEFFDYQCSHCIALAPRLEELLRTNKNVKVIYKVFSLGSRFSTRAAYAALAAGMQGKFASFHLALMKANQPLSEDAIMDAAKSVGLDVAKLKKDMASHGVEAQFKANTLLAKSLQIPGTPVLLIANTRSEESMKHIEYEFGEISEAKLRELVQKLG